MHWLDIVVVIYLCIGLSLAALMYSVADGVFDKTMSPGTLETLNNIRELQNSMPPNVRLISHTLMFLTYVSLVVLWPIELVILGYYIRRMEKNEPKSQ